jgi:hypothetical protein
MIDPLDRSGGKAMGRLLNMLVVIAVVVGGCGVRAVEPPSSDAELEVLSQPPHTVDPSARYLFYLHGRIIEDRGVRPTHPIFGVYEYEAILRAFADHGFVVISEARPAGTDGAEYAHEVASQVDALIDAGVPPEHVTVVGFSKGGGIAILASSILANDRVNFAFIAACGPWYASRTEIVPRGRLLGIREASDDLAGSCAALFARSPAAGERSEIVLELGGGHGAFYRPQPAWVEPVVTWARKPD